MAKKIKAVVLRENQAEKPSGKIVYINVAGALTEGIYWRTPVVDGKGFFVRYDYLKSAAKPTADSSKVLRVQNTIDNQYYWVLIADTDNALTFSNLCNAADTGVTPTMPAVKIPEILIEDKGSAFFTIADTLNAGEAYVITASKDGLLLTPDLTGNAYTSIANAVAAATNNWAAAGANVFANPSGTKVTFTAAGAKSGSITLAKALTFQSAVVTAIVGPANNYSLAAVVDGVAYAAITATTLALLAAACNADVSLSLLGSFSVSGGNKLQLLTTKANIATLTITQVTI